MYTNFKDVILLWSSVIGIWITIFIAFVYISENDEKACNQRYISSNYFPNPLHMGTHVWYNIIMRNHIEGTYSCMDHLYLHYFPQNCNSEEACETYLYNTRWPNGFMCPRCDHEKCYVISTRKLYECCECRTQVSLTAGTIMHKSKLSLLIWFKAIDLLIHNEREVTSLSLAQELGVNYRTARLMLFKIQLALHKKYDRIIPKQDESVPIREDEISLGMLRKRHHYNLPFGTVKWGLIPQRMRRFSPENLLQEWMRALTSIFLFPYFLGYWKTWGAFFS